MKEFSLVSYFKDGKWGLKNESGHLAIPAIYEEEIQFYSDYAAAKLNGKYGFIDQSGKTIIPFIYSDAGIFENGIGDVAINGKWGCVNKTGNLVIACEHLLPLSFNSPDEVVAVNKGGRWNHAKGEIIGGKWGLINVRGEMVVPYVYDDVKTLPNHCFYR